MSGLSNRKAAAGFGAEDEVWAGLDRSERYVVSESDGLSRRRILAILGVYGAVLCMGVIVLAA